MLQSERSFLGDKSVPWDTGCARRFLLITNEQKNILESIPGWSVEETEKGENPISEGGKSQKHPEQLPPTEIAVAGNTDGQTRCTPIPNSKNHLAKESNFNSVPPSKENSTKKNTFMQSISLYANKVVDMFSRRRSSSLSDVDYAKFGGNGLSHSKSETNLEDNFRSSDEMTCKKLDTQILNHPFFNGQGSCSESSVFSTTDGAASRVDSLFSKRMELLEKRFSLPKEGSLLLLAEEIGIGSNFGITEQETKKNGLPEGLVAEENGLCAEEIRRKTDFGTTEKEIEENCLPKGLLAEENSLLLRAEEIGGKTNFRTTMATEEERGLLKGMISEENSLLLHVEDTRCKINFRTTEEETEENGLSKALTRKQNSLLLLAEEIKNKINFSTTVSKSEINLTSVSEGQDLGTQQQSISLPDLVCDNNLKNSSNVLFDKIVACSQETDKVCTGTVDSHKSIENISVVPLVDSGCDGNGTNSMILQDEDSLPSIESILSTKIQESQIQAEEVLKSLTDASQNCGKTTVETDGYQSCDVIPAESSVLQTHEKIPEHRAEKKSMLLPNDGCFLKTIVADTENSHGNSNNDYFSKTIVAGTENSHSISNSLSKIIVADTEHVHSHSNNDYSSKSIVADTENSHSNCALENYNSASGKLGLKRKRLSRDNINPFNADKPFDAEVVVDTEHSHSNCGLGNYSSVMNNSASGKLGGKRKRQSKDNKPRKKSLVHSRVNIQYTADEVNNMIELMRQFQKKM